MVGGSPGLVLDETCNLKVVYSNPSTLYWMEIFHIDLLYKLVLMFVWKRPNINEWETGDCQIDRLGMVTNRKSHSHWTASVNSSWAIHGLFFFIFVISIQSTINKCSIKNAGDWIWTRVSWYWNRPLYQLCHNQCPKIVKLVFWCTNICDRKRKKEWRKEWTFKTAKVTNINVDDKQTHILNTFGKKIVKNYLFCLVSVS